LSQLEDGVSVDCEEEEVEESKEFVISARTFGESVLPVEPKYFLDS
jgi:hypothetical protein